MGKPPLVRTLFFPLFSPLASALVRNSIEAMKSDGVEEVSLHCGLYSVPR